MGPLFIDHITILRLWGLSVFLLMGTCSLPTIVGAQHIYDSDSIVYQKHRHLKANLTMAGFNVSLNRANRYLLESGKDWSDISWQTWKTNLQRFPKWDWDLYSTNWFAHPYQGAIYYNCARSLKIGYLPSAGYALLGTTLWEYFGENLPPSANDFITTTLGGIQIGEIIFRLSENILDDRSYGKKRLKREILATLVNPVGGANRLFYGQLAHHEDFANHIHLPTRSRFWASGTRVLGAGELSTQEIVPSLGIDLEYGEKRVEGLRYKPFEYFWLQAALRFDKYDQDISSFQVPLPYLNLSSTVVLFGKVPNRGFLRSGMLGVFQNYNYFKSYSYQLSTIAFSIGGIKSIKSELLNIDIKLHGGPVVLGAVGSTAIDHIRPEGVGEERDYVMGSGFTGKADIHLDLGKNGRLEVQYDYWMLYINENLDGNESIHFLKSRYLLPLSPKISLGLSYNYYHRAGHYSFDTHDETLTDYNSEISILTYYHLD